MKRSRRSCIRGALLAVGIGIAVPVWGQPPSQTGIIAFKDGCTERLYAMRADGSGRVELPLPPLALPTDRYWALSILDVSTSGPVTVVYRFILARVVVVNGSNVLTFVDQGLAAVQVSDVGGVLTPDPPVRLPLPLVAGVDPNLSLWGSLSSTDAGDRLALVASNTIQRVLMTARVERDAAAKVQGLSDLVVIGDLYTLGVPDDEFPTSNGFTGLIDYAPDGNSIVASIYYDLWRIHLAADATFLSAEWLTPGTVGFAEWDPDFSPDGTRIAYTGHPVGSSTRDMNIYALDATTGAVTPLTTGKGKGASAGARTAAMWSSDSAWIAFSAHTAKTARGLSCSFLVNTEIFLVRADGSTKATQITSTNGTSVEAFSEWGW